MCCALTSCDLAAVRASFPGFANAKALGFRSVNQCQRRWSVSTSSVLALTSRLLLLLLLSPMGLVHLLLHAGQY
jgi:hypothetical protein